MNAPNRFEAPTLALDDDGGEAIGLEVVDARHARGAFERARLVDVDLVRCDLSGADFSKARCSAVDLRRARLDGLRGVGSLAGATIDFEQLFGLAPALAEALGLHIDAGED